MSERNPSPVGQQPGTENRQSPLDQLGEVTRWAGDLVLGIRLAVGGGRSSWVRLALTGLGIGLGVAVLLVAACLPTAITARDDRASDLMGRPGAQPVAGVAPLYMAESFEQFRDLTIRGSYLLAGGPTAPVPPGAGRVPGDGEIILSPELAALLASPEGELLRPRFPQRVVGTISQAGLEGPYELRYYAGDATVDKTSSTTVYEFGRHPFGDLANPFLYVLSVLFVVILLFPVLVFVGISTRLSGAQRDRRLAALRLIGASAHRVRRIASGEALLGAFVGLVVGFALFYYLRQYTEQVRLAQAALFRSDLTPSPPLLVLVVLFVPVLAVATAMVAMRRTVVEPLGVVRQARPVRRSLWWRIVPIVAGVGLLLSQVGKMGRDNTERPSEYVLATGVAALMLGIPLVLPWLVERSVGHLNGGSLSWQLAVRRLQLDSGSAARVVGGVAVVLAGAIALQTILASAEKSIVGSNADGAGRNNVVVSAREGDDVERLLVGAEGVTSVYEIRTLGSLNRDDIYVSIAIGDCAALRAELKVEQCREGDAFVSADSIARPGDAVTFIENNRDEQVRRGSWTLPAAQSVSKPEFDVYVTPSVLAGVVVPLPNPQFHAVLDPAVPDAVEHVRNAVAPLHWRVNSYYVGKSGLGEAEQVFATIRQALLAGSVLVLILVGASLLVMALEQIRERRRPLAVLVASGVPRRVLAWSVLWQNAFPLLLAMVVAVGTGAGLGALLLRVLGEPVALDWAGVSALTGVTAVAVLAVTLLTLPSLRRATGALGLRSE